MKNEWNIEKFDIIVGNPPYNDGSNNRGSAHVLWDKFVVKSLNILVEDGYLNMVHPDGWRSADGGFVGVKNLMTSKQIHYLELHNTDDGYKTFGAYTTYDFYCLKNTPNNNFISTIKTQDNEIVKYDLSTLSFIPNGMFSEIVKLMAKPNEEKVNVLRCTSYHTQKDYVSKDITNENIYPIVYTTQKDGTIKFRWSSRNDKGHFNIPKVIWSNGGATTPIIDTKGEYGITEFSYAIIDDVENLEMIKRALESKSFNKLMSMTDGTTGVGRHRYNRKAIATFRKDFYKQFLND
jgi:hypothetical protein